MEDRNKEETVASNRLSPLTIDMPLEVCQTEPGNANIFDPDDPVEASTSDVFKFSDDVQSAIDQLMPKDDPMYRPDFDVVGYINSLFPTEQSLSGIDDVISQVDSQIQEMDKEVASIIHAQSSASKDGHQALLEAKSAIKELFTRIREIKQKTDTSEIMVKEITRDIKQLDTAKKNLTASITTLNHLHMLLSGVETLESLVKRRQYGEMANLLPGIMNVLEHFERYMHIPQVKELADKVAAIRQDLGAQVLAEFKDSVSGGRPFAPSSTMVEACKVASVLDPSVKNDLIHWFQDLQLSEYSVLFEDTQDSAWLDKIDQRYNWFRRFLCEFEAKYERVFPTAWDMPEQLSLAFCDRTGRDLDKVMAKRRSEIKANLLQFAINKTAEFETLLMKRFPHNHRPSVSTAPGPNVEPEKPHPFCGIIRKCFEPYLTVFTAAHDASLKGLLDEYVRAYQEKGPPKQEAEAGAVNLQSASDLFMFYRKCILGAGQVSLSNALLLDLTWVFKKYLREYAKRCLSDFLPKINASSSGNTAGLIQSLLKEGDIPRLTSDEQYRICCILVTAEYCAETTKQLQNKLIEKLGEEHKDKLDMVGEQEVFYQVITSCVTLLVQDLETYCDPALSAMTKKQWATVEGVGDESSYVVSIKAHIRQVIPRIRDHLFTARKYFIQFCTKFATCFIAKYISAISKCKQISLDGAEQLLLDTHALKTELLILPNVESTTQRKPPNNYTKLVVKGMTKVEMMLKLVMSSDESAEAFVESFLRLLPDGTPHDFQQILELRGLRRMEQAALIEFYQKRTTTAGMSPLGGSGGGDDIGERSFSPPQVLSPSPAAPLLATFLPPETAMAHDSRIKKLEKLIKKRL